jgi:hypothetical protein
MKARTAADWTRPARMHHLAELTSPECSASQSRACSGSAFAARHGASAAEYAGLELAAASVAALARPARAGPQRVAAPAHALGLARCEQHVGPHRALALPPAPALQCALSRRSSARPSSPRRPALRPRQRTPRRHRSLPEQPARAWATARVPRLARCSERVLPARGLDARLVARGVPCRPARRGRQTARGRRRWQAQRRSCPQAAHTTSHSFTRSTTTARQQPAHQQPADRTPQHDQTSLRGSAR